jgi:hypothetical protein
LENLLLLKLIFLLIELFAEKLIFLVCNRLNLTFCLALTDLLRLTLFLLTFLWECELVLLVSVLVSDLVLCLLLLLCLLQPRPPRTMTFLRPDLEVSL